MPELAGDLVALVSARAFLGIAVGFAGGGILWSLQLAPRRAALAVALVLTTTFIAASWGLALLAALQLALIGASGRLAGVRPGALDILGTSGVISLCAVGSLSGLALAYWLAAGCGAAVGGATGWTTEILATDVEGDPRLAGQASIRWQGLSATVLVGGCLTIAALWLRVVGAGEPALAAVGSLLGLTVARRAGRTRHWRLAVVALVAGTSTAILTALMP
ncbi:MAG TPA: hypothetical protein QGG47_08585 [Acidobacteriota bacterium]|nr:hypothetical protein [Acidobacteriota bacterium]